MSKILKNQKHYRISRRQDHKGDHYAPTTPLNNASNCGPLWDFVCPLQFFKWKSCKNLVKISKVLLMTPLWKTSKISIHLWNIHYPWTFWHPLPYENQGVQVWETFTVHAQSKAVTFLGSFYSRYKVIFPIENSILFSQSIGKNSQLKVTQ
jgi:hypothetical protein